MVRVVEFIILLVALYVGVGILYAQMKKGK